MDLLFHDIDYAHAIVGAPARIVNARGYNKPVEVIHPATGKK